MASKRRNMFHKNKTQETTEKVPPSKPIILDDRGNELRSIAGPYEEGSQMKLTCIVTGESIGRGLQDREQRIYPWGTLTRFELLNMPAVDACQRQHPDTSLNPLRPGPNALCAQIL
ncbi:hypothetical protein AAG570_007637 [Ranatra chinensis]|uniref:Ig-like domain-containing protein n=1 Tax=Ranatra chinensis TaxID=642074 RepID=A0ABD0Y7C2_9HEMI